MRRSERMRKGGLAAIMRPAFLPELPQRAMTAGVTAFATEITIGSSAVPTSTWVCGKGEEAHKKHTRSKQEANNNQGSTPKNTTRPTDGAKPKQHTITRNHESDKAWST